MNKKLTSKEKEEIYQQIVRNTEAKGPIDMSRFALISEKAAIELRNRVRDLNNFRMMSLIRSSKRTTSL